VPPAPVLGDLRLRSLHGGSEVRWPRNGYLGISRNTKLDEIKHFFRGISAEFREIPRKDFAKISHIFAKYLCYFRGISRNFEILVTNFYISLLLSKKVLFLVK
jgi:hypothetical protein